MSDPCFDAWLWRPAAWRGIPQPSNCLQNHTSLSSWPRSFWTRWPPGYMVGRCHQRGRRYRVRFPYKSPPSGLIFWVKSQRRISPKIPKIISNQKNSFKTFPKPTPLGNSGKRAKLRQSVLFTEKNGWIFSKLVNKAKMLTECDQNLISKWNYSAVI